MSKLKLDTKVVRAVQQELNSTWICTEVIGHLKGEGGIRKSMSKGSVE